MFIFSVHEMQWLLVRIYDILVNVSIFFASINQYLDSVL